jgi:carbamoyl-phosphate synthase small subunit
MKATLVLEDGSSFSGEALGVSAELCGEVILNTAVVGYQEMLTDPANAGKILVLTYPLIGNYGVASKFNESKKVWLSGLVIKEKSKIYSNWQAKASFDAFIKEQNVLTISEVDTRTLAVHLRDKGQMLGIISTLSSDIQRLLFKIGTFRKNNTQDYIRKISVSKSKLVGRHKSKYKVAVLDLGITNSVIRQLETLGLSVQLLPYNTKPQDVLSLKARGLIISNGPEGDLVFNEVASNVQDLIGKTPILGISTGHQILACALGAKTKKMKLGHRGVNYPIKQPGSYKAEITVQNHAYIVENESLSKIKSLKVTALNLNDHSVEEIESRKLKLIGVQYYPVSPGFNEVSDVFNRFLKMIKED